MQGLLFGRPKGELDMRPDTKLKATLLIFLMASATLVGCIGGDDEETEKKESENTEETKPEWLDASDAGYTYASDVDNHRSLMQDLCDIKAAASSDGGYDFAEAKNIYMNGKNAQKDSGSYRTLAGFAAAEGKNHNYDSFYNMTGSVDAHIMAAMDGTGDFENVSDTVRYQGIAKLTANMGMVAYTIHELGSAATKAAAGNVDNDSGAPHNWDEGWAFFHGPDEHWSCSPAYTMKKRAADFGTTTNDVSNALSSTEAAMVAGLAALQANDSTAYNDAINTVMKNLIITYSQATLKYAMKMDSNDTAAKYQAEGYAFWKTMEAYAAPYTDDGCYNMAAHYVHMMGDVDAAACDAFVWTNGSRDANGTNDTCYNSVTHATVSGATEEICDGFGGYFYENYGATQINNILDLTDESQLGTSYDLTAHLQPVWDHYGITADDIGTYE